MIALSRQLLGQPQRLFHTFLWRGGYCKLRFLRDVFEYLLFGTLYWDHLVSGVSQGLSQPLYWLSLCRHLLSTFSEGTCSAPMREPDSEGMLPRNTPADI